MCRTPAATLGMKKDDAQRICNLASVAYFRSLGGNPSFAAE